MAEFTTLDVIPSITSLILLISSLVFLLAYYWRTKYIYWKRRGVPYVKPEHWFFGNTKDLFFQTIPRALFFERIYKELDGHRFGGFYQMAKPSVMIRDPELIRTVLIKNFSNFHDRFPDAANDETNSSSNNLLFLCGQRWRNVRYKLNAAFSPVKLRQMETLMGDCVRELDKYLSIHTSVDSMTGHILDVHELMAKFTTDVIGTCAFGFECNAISDKDSEFRQLTRRTFTFTQRENFLFVFRTILPRFIKLLSLSKLRLGKTKARDFFQSALKQAVKHRESSAQKRNDFLQIMLDIQAEEMAQLESIGREKKGHQQSNDQPIDSQNEIHAQKSDQVKNLDGKPSEILFTESIISSNSIAFFSAGFETTASSLSYCLYELALNPEICEKLKDEVESVKHAHKGHLDYNAMKELIYMDSVLAETVRKYPIDADLSRQCVVPFQMPGSSVVIEKGTPVFISVHGLHHDPKYFPEPEKFSPERFSTENKASIVPGSYLPFGDGPRMCIGMRFAWFEMKSVLSFLVSNYTFHACEKTPIPLKINCRSFLHIPTGGVWIKVKKRS